MFWKDTISPRPCKRIFSVDDYICLPAYTVWPMAYPKFSPKSLHRQASSAPQYLPPESNQIKKPDEYKVFSFRRFR
jgi:hypothetical protein